jgi:hypothetical protein
VSTLFDCCKESDALVKGIALQSGFQVFGSEYNFDDKKIIAANGFLINMFVTDKNKTLETYSGSGPVTVALKSLSVSDMGKVLKAGYVLVE